MNIRISLAAAAVCLAAVATSCSGGAKQPEENIPITESPNDTTSPYDSPRDVDSEGVTHADSAAADTARKAEMREAAERVKEEADKQKAETEAIKDKAKKETDKQLAENEKAIKNAQKAVKAAKDGNAASAAKTTGNDSTAAAK